MTTRAAKGYREMHRAGMVEGASPHTLTSMLFSGLLAQIEVARGVAGGNSNGDREMRRTAIDRALAIVQELQGALRDLDSNEMSIRLFSLYSYVTGLLIDANRIPDNAKLDEVIGLVSPLRDAWDSIAPDRTVVPGDIRIGDVRAHPG